MSAYLVDSVELRAFHAFATLVEVVDGDNTGLRVLPQHTATRAHREELTGTRHRSGRDNLVGRAERRIEQLVRLGAAGVCGSKVTHLHAIKLEGNSCSIDGK